MKKIQKIDRKKSFFFTWIGLGIAWSMALNLSPLALAKQKEDESQFIRAGTLSYSKEYILAKDFSHIVFKIKNHNPRTVTQIFGWVYRTPAPGKEEKLGKKMILVNNPHRGGLLVKGGPHRPGKVAHWRFLLDRDMLEATEKDKFTLRVSPKGVFFARIEPPKIPTDEDKKKKKSK